MNSFHLTLLALDMTNQGHPPIVEHRDDALRQYWAHSQCRVQRWQSSLHKIEQDIRNAPDLATIQASKELPALRELFFGDILTAVFTSWINVTEKPQPDHNPMVSGVFTTARRATQRGLSLLEIAAQRNARLRRPCPEILDVIRAHHRAAVWCDILLARIPGPKEFIGDYGYQSERIAEFRKRLSQLSARGRVSQFSSKLLADVRSYFSEHESSASGNEALNGQIVNSMHAALGIGSRVNSDSASIMHRPSLSDQSAMPA